MNKRLLKLSLFTFIVGLIVFVTSIKVYAAVTTKPVIPVMNSTVGTYDTVFAQVFDFSLVNVFDVTEDDGDGGMVAVSGATFANTAITVTIDSNFYVGSIPFPSDLSKGIYIIWLRGSADATPDKDDDVIGDPIIVQWGGSGLQQLPSTGVFITDAL
ncbi:MAG: hypothetical protein PVI90_07105 [Desulfobacteraceae bacterium]|jgi:hypothetical protein